MKVLYPLLGIVIISMIGITGFAFTNLNLQLNLLTNDQIKIDSVSVSDLGNECFSAPCFFRDVIFNLTIINTYEKNLDSICLDRILLKVLPGSNNANEWFVSSDSMMTISCIKASKTIPIGVWSENFSTTIILNKIPTPNENFPTIIDIQLSYANNLIKSPIYQLNLNI